MHDRDLSVLQGEYTSSTLLESEATCAEELD